MAIDLVDKLRPDVVLTTSPLHATHDVGRWLKSRRPELRWVADFRDPFLIDVRYGPFGLRRFAARRLRRYAESIYQTADLVTNAIEFESRWIRLKYRYARSKVRALPNGLPVEMFSGDLKPIATPNGRRSIRAMGATDPSQRLRLAAAAARLVESGEDVELRFIGQGPPDADALGAVLDDRVVLTGQVPHSDAPAQLLGADVLVCPLSVERSAAMLLSSKLFEFFACGKPIIVINPTRPDRLLVRSLKGVRVLREPGEEELTSAFQWALSDAAQPPAEQGARMREKYSRRTQARQLAAWLDELTDRRGKMHSSPIE